jgi:transcriptional regulator with XRE-family HTH domain
MSKTNGTKLISNVRQICAAKGWTRNEFEGRMLMEQGVNMRTARNIYNGYTNIYTITVAKTARVLGVDFGDVIGFEK